MNSHVPNRDLQADFQEIDDRMLKRFKLAIESDNKKQRRSGRGFMSKLMDDDLHNTKRFPKLWAAMCEELNYQIAQSTKPISQIRDDMKAAGYTKETIKRFEQFNSKDGH